VVKMLKSKSDRPTHRAGRSVNAFIELPAPPSHPSPLCGGSRPQGMVRICVVEVLHDHG